VIVWQSQKEGTLGVSIGTGRFQRQVQVSPEERLQRACACAVLLPVRARLNRV